jgi:DNA-binding transcriptional LysR family regulator
MEFDNIEAIKKAVEIGPGLSLLPSPTIEREVRAGSLAQVPLKATTFVRPLGLVRRRGRPLSAAVRLTLAELRRDAPRPIKTKR